MAPRPKLRPLRIIRRDVGHAPVGLREQAQLLENVFDFLGPEVIEDEPDLRRARATQLTEQGCVFTRRQPQLGRRSTPENLTLDC